MQVGQKEIHSVQTRAVKTAETKAGPRELRSAYSTADPMVPKTADSREIPKVG